MSENDSTTAPEPALVRWQLATLGSLGDVDFDEFVSDPNSTDLHDVEKLLRQGAEMSEEGSDRQKLLHCIAAIAGMSV